MARQNRRGELLTAALELFVERGYEGTSVADLAGATGLSKAAFVYHFGSKEDLLVELAEPLLDELDAVLDRHEHRDEADGIEATLEDYLAALHRNGPIARWIDGDKSVLNHPELGARIDANNRRAHRIILCGARPTRTSRALASAVLGMLWRPVRNGYLPDDPSSRRAMVAFASRAASYL